MYEKVGFAPLQVLRAYSIRNIATSAALYRGVVAESCVVILHLYLHIYRYNSSAVFTPFNPVRG